jgi:hypothetical protein
LTAALRAGGASALCKQYVAEHKIEQKSHGDFHNAKEAGKELILNAVSNNALDPLKKQYIVTISSHGYL